MDFGFEMGRKSVESGASATRGQRERVLPALAKMLSLVVALLVLCWCALCLRAAGHYRAGVTEQGVGRLLLAAREYESAVGCYAPLNPYSKRAAIAMLEIAKGTMDTDPALSAEVEDRFKRSVLSTRWLVQPYADLLKGEREKGAAPVRDPNPLLFFLSMVAISSALAAWWVRGLSPRVRLAICVTGFSAWGLLLHLC